VRALAIACCAVLLLGSRCNVPGTLDPCGAYRKTCPVALGGGCCGEEDECVADRCVYRGRDTTLGAGDAGVSMPRVYP
jgi:hypothetical protein